MGKICRDAEENFKKLESLGKLKDDTTIGRDILEMYFKNFYSNQ